MYIDAITYTDKPVSDILLNDFPEHIFNDEKIRLKVNKIQTHRIGDHSVSLIRCRPSDLDVYDEDGNRTDGWLRQVFDVLQTGHTRTPDCPYAKLTPQDKAKLDKCLTPDPETNLINYKFGEFC